MLEDKTVFGNAFFKERFVKRFITYQINHPTNSNILNLLTILKILSIIIVPQNKWGEENCWYIYVRFLQ